VLSWIRKCENYFDLYDVHDYFKEKLASMYFTSNAAFWAQSLEFSVQEIYWYDLYKAVCGRFERDQQNLLLRQFFRTTRGESCRLYSVLMLSVF
jgi:hypothetical protein